jgi:hypothetical protein
MPDDPKVLDFNVDKKQELTFLTDVRVDQIVEIAELPVKNTGWQPGRGESWARVEGCLIFRKGDQAKVRTSLTREEVWELIAEAYEDCQKVTPLMGSPWITVPFTIRESGVV